MRNKKNGKRRRAVEGERESKKGVNDKGGLDNNCERTLKNKKHEVNSEYKEKISSWFFRSEGVKRNGMEWNAFLPDNFKTFQITEPKQNLRLPARWEHIDPLC